MKFILFCVTLDLSDNLTETRIVKNSNNFAQTTCAKASNYMSKINTRMEHLLWMDPTIFGNEIVVLKSFAENESPFVVFSRKLLILLISGPGRRNNV